MAKDAVATMGQILTDDVGGRDAVHVAVISAQAAGKLSPSQHVGRKPGSTDDRLVVGVADKPIGIVDPFLEVVVQPGQRFWLYLYPRTITSLRHNWTHPEFEDVASTYAPPGSKLAAEKWMQDFAGGYGYTSQDMIDAATAWIRSGDYLCDGGTFEGERVPPEFWEHYEAITGKKVASDDRENFFTCSC